MGKSAAARIEDAIRQKWHTRKLRARGLWLTVRDRIEENEGKRPGFLMHEGRSMRTEEVAHVANTSVTMTGDLLKQLEAVGLIAFSTDGAIFSPVLIRLQSARSNNAARVNRSRGRGKALRNAEDGITSDPCNAPVTRVVPPEVSPPITPSSLPPSEIYPGAVRAEVSADVQQPTYEAFDQWAAVSRGWGLDAAAGEHRKIATLLDTLKQETPIVRNGEAIGRHLLAAKAADLCKRNGKEFKRVAYACEIVRGLLAEWEAKGLPGSGANGRQPNGPPVPPRRNIPAVTKFEA